MQSFQLLGGKYQQGEQILPGVIQTFRAYEVPTGRPVFIHRIPSNDAAAKEVADLLSAGLIHSPVVRKMLLDVYETGPYRFVVTEPARQCVPLRDWLEREADGEPERAPQAVVEPAPVSSSPPEEPVAITPVAKPAAAPESPVEDELETEEPAPEAETSDFARLFHEALSGKLERSRHNAVQQNAVPPQPAGGNPPLEPEVERPKAAEPARSPVTLVQREQAPPVQAAPAAAPSPAPERDLFQVVEAERAGRSTLIIVLVVLAVLAIFFVVFLVLFVTR